LKNPFKLEKDGTVLIPTAPGLGIELDENKLEDKLGHDWKNPQTYDETDGSVVDW
jgi:galactonate dehydratase